MCRTRTLSLSPPQRRRLVSLRDHHPKPYLREKAAGLLKIADGWTIQDVARFGLLKPRSPHTVRDWLHRYQAHGLTGLKIKAGRGRKPAFFSLGTDPRRRPHRGA